MWRRPLCSMLGLGCSLSLAASQAERPTKASFQGIGDLPGGPTESCALAVSADGTVVTGWSACDRGSRAFRWSEGMLNPISDGASDVIPSVGHAVSAEGGVIIGQARSGDTTIGFRFGDRLIAPLSPPADGGFADAWGVSADGRVVAGNVQRSGHSRALLWDGAGVSVLPDAAGLTSGLARAVSADGTIVAGYGEAADGLMPIVWRNKVPLILSGLDGVLGGEAHAVSADGGIIVGSCKSRFGIEACIWRGETVKGLGSISREHEFLSTARALSADGAVIVGTAIDDRDVSQAVVWDEANGARVLHRVLAGDFGLELTGWHLQAATGASGDGRTIVGCGRNPSGEPEGWVARLPEGWWRDQSIPLVANQDAEGANATDRRPRLGRGVGLLSALMEPHGAAIDKNGNIYVADTGHNLVRVFDSTGKVRNTFGSPGSGIRLAAARDVCIADDGTLYVADAGNDRVQAIGADGRLRKTWGDKGDSPGRLDRPEGIAVRDGLVYVADTGNDRIVVFDRAGQQVRSFGQFGHGQGDLNRPTDLAVSADGRIFVADTGNHRVAVFDPEGKFVRSFGASAGATPGLFNRPTGIECRGESVYVVDQANHRIQVFSLDGAPRDVWGLQARRPHEGGGRISFPARIAVAPDQTRALICEPIEDRCQLFGMSEASASTSFQQGAFLDAAPLSNVASAMHAGGEILTLVDDTAGHVLVYRATEDQPLLLTKVGAAGSGPGQLGRVEDLWFDPASSRLFLADAGNRRLAVFDLALQDANASTFTPNLGRLNKTIDFTALHVTPGRDVFSGARPRAIAFHPEGRIAVVAEGADEVVILDRQFSITGRLHGPLDSPTGLQDPVDVAFGQDGKTVYVLDAGASAVIAFDLQGTYIRSWGHKGSGPGEFLQPSGIVTAKGALYVCDRGAHRVQKFDTEGRLLLEWGRTGIGRGEFFKPRDIAVDAAGRVYVNDFGNRRIQVFTSEGDFLYALGAPIVVYPTLVTEQK